MSTTNKIKDLMGKKSTTKKGSPKSTTKKKPTTKTARKVSLPVKADPTDRPFRTRDEMREIVLSVRDDINKHFKDEVIQVGADVKTEDFGRLPIGNFSLDIASGGGIFIGGVISISGDFSSGKTLNGLHFIAECQRQGLICLWAALEPFDAEWAEHNGVDTDLLLVSEPSGAEEALEVAIRCQWRTDVDVIVIDSVEALESTKEQEKEIGESRQMGIKQKLIGEYLRKFRALNNLRKRRSRKDPSIRPLTLFLINQLREKPTQFGDPEYEPGGRALGFYSDIMIRLRSGPNIYFSPKQGVVYDRKPADGVVVGKSVRYRVHKNKTFRFAQVGEFDMYSDKGGPVGPGNFDNAKSAIVEGIAWGVIDRPTQSTYTVGGMSIRGKDNLIKALREDEDLVQYIKEEVLGRMYQEGSNIEVDNEQE